MARTVRVIRWLGDVRQDIAYAGRSLRKQPGFAAVAILTLALGIGAATAVFSIVEGVLLRPLPYGHVDRLVAVWEGHLKDKGLAKVFAPFDDFDNWQRNSQQFEQLAAATWAVADRILTGRGAAKVVLAVPVTANFFSMLDVPPLFGRTFQPDDPGRGCSVVLAHRFWRSVLNAQRDIVGQSLALDNRACAVVGVMPERFAFFPEAADMWTVITPNREQLPAPYQGVGVFGRLKSGATLERAQAELSALHRQAHGGDAHAAAFGPTVYPLQEEFTWLAGRNLRLTLLMLLAAVGIVQLIACVNVANLFLSRALVRQREFAIRAALGSGRFRLARQVLTEGLLFASASATLGIAIAYGSVRYFRYVSPVDLPPGVTVGINATVLGFAVALAVSTALVFGFIPAWRASRTDISGTLKAAGPAFGGRTTGSRTGRALVVVEMSCAMALLVGAGLLGQSIVRLGTTPLGFDPHGVLTMTVKLPRTTYQRPAQRSDMYERLLAAIGRAPAVEGAAFSTALLRGHSNSLLTIEGRPVPSLDTALPDVGQDFVSPDYFRVMNVPILDGRSFAPTDRADRLPVAIVNEALARKYFPATNAIGQHIKYGAAPGDAPWVTIVGVAGNQKSMNVFQEMSWVETPLMFRPLSQGAPPDATLLLRTATAAAPSSMGATIQRLVADVDPDLPVANIQTLEARIARDLAFPQFRAVVLGGFALLALLLAVVGLYAVLSQLVAQRTHELGVRMALGATSRDVVRLIAVQGGAPTVAGLALGALAVAAFGRLLASVLYGVTAADPLTVGGVAVVLLIMAAVATLVPARRATRVDPLVALRTD